MEPVIYDVPINYKQKNRILHAAAAQHDGCEQSRK